MHLDAAQTRPESARVRRRRLRLRTVGSMDRRTTAARRAGELVHTFETALGGQLSAAQRLAVDRAATLLAIAQDAQVRRLQGDLSVSLEDIARLDNAANRAVRALGLERQREPAEPSLADYVASRKAGAAG